MKPNEGKLGLGGHIIAIHDFFVLSRWNQFVLWHEPMVHGIIHNLKDAEETDKGLVLQEGCEGRLMMMGTHEL